MGRSGGGSDTSPGSQFPPIRRTTEFHALTEADALAQAAPDVSAAAVRGFVPISQAWSDDNGIKVLTVAYEQRYPDVAEARTKCPNCSRRWWASGHAGQCPRCGYLFGEVAADSRPAAPRAGPSTARVVMTTLLLLIAAAWFLNNTRLGLEIKCRFLNDVGACLAVALTSEVEAGGGSATPDSTVDAGYLAPLALLQWRQAGRRGPPRPPRLTGITWSAVVAIPVQPGSRTEQGRPTSGCRSRRYAAS